MADISVSNAGEFGYLVLAAILAGVLLYIYGQIKIKAGVTV